ncbi:MAG: hypothetical protein R3E58_05890 [Phycisphaerae bacterium]
MKITFEKMDENFTAMQQGKPRNPGIFPGPNEHEVKAPPVRKKPPVSFNPKLNNAARENKPQEDDWDLYVRKFIEKYELTEAQSVSAHSILRECKTRATAYRLSKERDFEEAKKRLTEVQKSDQPAEIKNTKEKVWKGVLEKLRKPVDDLFVELKDRLAKIPNARRRNVPAICRIQAPQQAKTASKDAALRNPPIAPSRARPRLTPTEILQANAARMQSTQPGEANAGALDCGRRTYPHQNQIVVDAGTSDRISAVYLAHAIGPEITLCGMHAINYCLLRGLSGT